MSLRPLRSHLYAPGNNAKLVGKVFDAGADAVVLDLEDAVSPAEKEKAREMVAAAVSERAGQPSPATFVRINHPSTALAESDIMAVVRSGLDGIRAPKIETAAEVGRLVRWVNAAEEANGAAPGSTAVICTIESATGVWNAAEIAAASAQVIGLAFGVVDFVRDIGATPTLEGAETLHAKSRLVLASRVAGVRAPIDGVHTAIDDLEGLERSARGSRALGFFGKSAIHPRQVAVINEVFTPSESEIAWARGIIEAYEEAEASGAGAIQTASSGFVDPAIVRRAQDVLTLAEAVVGDQV